MNTTAMDKPARRLNGWQRIGIVVSVLWAIGSSITALISMPSRAYYRPALRLVPLDGGKVKQIPEIWVPPEGRRQREIWVALVFVPILLGWIFTYAAIGAFRWIAAGFRR
jgi:hypothetical protein